MIHESKHLEFNSLKCASGGHELSLEVLRTGLGRCPHCHAERFNAVIIKKIDGTDLAEMVTERSWLAEATGEAGAESWNMETTYSLAGVPGDDLLAWAEAPVTEALAAIHAHRISIAKKNLKPDQRICPACKSIYTVSRYGNRYIDYCSRHCRKAARKGIRHIPRKQIRRSKSTSLRESMYTLYMIIGFTILLIIALAVDSCRGG